MQGQVDTKTVEPNLGKKKTYSDLAAKRQELSNRYFSNVSEKYDTALALTDQKAPEDFKELDDKIKTMIMQGKTMRKDGTQRNSACTVCGKEGVYSQIKHHIEANHIDGLLIPCNLCGKTFRSRIV